MYVGGEGGVGRGWWKVNSEFLQEWETLIIIFTYGVSTYIGKFFPQSLNICVHTGTIYTGTIVHTVENIS